MQREEEAKKRIPSAKNATAGPRDDIYEMLFFCLCVLHVAVSSNIDVTPPPVEWVQGYTFGVSESHPHAGVQTADGGFLVVGDGQNYTDATHRINRTIYVLRTDSEGNTAFQTELGETGYNYGKFGIELSDGRLAIAGAVTEESELVSGRDQKSVLALKRALFILDGKSGKVLQRLTLNNTASEEHKRDGFMCVDQAPDGALVATGFVGGENSTSGYIDEPMFLIGKGHVSIARFDADPSTGHYALSHESILDDAGEKWRAMQGMRMVYHASSQAYAVSHTTSFDGGGNFEFGLSLIQIGAQASKTIWRRSFLQAPPMGAMLHTHMLSQGETTDRW